MDDRKEKKLTKETSSEPSFRVLYYGANGAAVPFKWESQPGTPKHALFSDYSGLPPLTPPPSYLSRREPDSPCNTKSKSKRMLKMVVLLTALPRLVRRGSHVSPASSSYSYSSSSSSMSSSRDVVSSYYSPTTRVRKTRSLMFALMDEEELGEAERGGRRSSSMRMCFGGGFGHSMSSVKNALFSAVGCRRRSSSSNSVDYFL